MLLNFKILAFFWRQFYQEKGREWAGRNSLKTTTPSKISKTKASRSNQSSLKWWIHSLFISRSKMFSRVTNLLWNDEYIHYSFPDPKRSPESPIFSEMMNTFTWPFAQWWPWPFAQSSLWPSSLLSRSRSLSRRRSLGHRRSLSRGRSPLFSDFFGGCSTEHYYISINSSTLEFFWRRI